MSKTLTVSLNKEIESKWERINQRGVGQSEFMRDAINFYLDNGYSFKIHTDGDAEEREADFD
jgi:hypothetical protein